MPHILGFVDATFIKVLSLSLAGTPQFILAPLSFVMPNASTAPLRKRTTARSLPLQRRLSEEEARQKFRRERMRPAGPIDDWLCANSSGLDDSESPLTQDEDKCIVTITVQHDAVRHDSGTGSLWRRLCCELGPG